jgi:membrane-associated protein
MEAFLNNIIFWINSSKYILLFLGAAVEGPVVMMTGGFLYKIGQFSFLPMYLALVFGDFAADIVWYCIGRFATRHTIFKYGKIVNLTPETLEKIEDRFRKYHQNILIISKLTMGLGFATVVLTVAGIFKVPFKRYAVINLVGGVVWVAFLVTVGYFFGNIYASISGPEKFVFAIVVFLIFIFGIRFANEYLMKKEI